MASKIERRRVSYKVINTIRKRTGRQVQDAKVALQHNLGLGGACVMTMYRRD